MSPEEVRIRSMELAFRVVTAGGPRTVAATELEGAASHVVGWVNQTPPTSDELRDYLDKCPAELRELRSALAEHFPDLLHSDRAYVLGRAIHAVLECRKARASKTDASGAANG